MKHKGVQALVLLFVVFNIVAFAPPFNKNEGFWIAYFAGLIALVSQVYFFKKSFKASSTTKSRFYGYPIARIGVIYLAVQLVFSIVEMTLANSVNSWIYLIINLVVIAFAALGCISTEVARDEVVKQDEVVSLETSAMRAMRVRAKSIRESCKNKDLQYSLDELVACIEFSDPKSNKSTKNIDEQIQLELENLADLSLSGSVESAKELVLTIQALVSERNDLCKMTKS